MATTVSQLSAKISVEGANDAKKSLKDVGQSAEDTSNSFKSFLGSAFSVAAGQAIFQGLADTVGFLKNQVVDLFQSTFAQQTVMAQTEQVIKSTGDASGETAQSIEGLADSLSKVTDFSDTVTESGENMLLTFTNIGQDVFPEATRTMLDMSQALGQDVKSSAIQLGKALNDPLTGITALQRVGVTFTDSQKQVIQSMMDTGDVAGAQSVILQELQREFGGSAEAAGKTAAGQFQILGNEMDDVKQKIGTALLPILQQFTGYIQSNVMPIVDSFSSWFIATAVPDIQQFANYLQGTAIPAIEHAASWIDTMAHNSQVLIPTLSAIGAVVAAVVVPAFAAWAVETVAATWPLLAVAAAVAGLTAGFMALWNNNAGFRSFIQGLGQDFSNLGSWMQKNAIPALQQIGKWIGTYVWPFLQQMGGFMASVFIPVWQNLVNLWQSQLAPLFQQLLPTFGQFLPLLKLIGIIIAGVVLTALGLLVGAIDGIAKGIGYFVEGLGTLIGGIVQIFTGIMQVAGGFIQFFDDLFHGRWSKLVGDLGQIWQGLLNILGGLWNSIVGIFQAAWGLISGIVGGMVQGVISFFTTLYNEIVGHSLIPDLVNGVISWIAQLPGRVWGFIESMVKGTLERFNMFKAEAIVIFDHIVDQIIGAFSGIGSGIWSGVKSGLNDAIGLLNSWIGNLNKVHIDIGDFHAGFSVPTIPYLASGGRIGQSGFAVVGEQGPETVLLPRGAQVYSHSQTNDLLSALSGLLSSSSGGSSTVILELEGRQFARAVAPHLTEHLRLVTASRT